MLTQTHCIERDSLRILLLSDTHGYVDPNIASLSERCEIAIHAGDVMDAQVLNQLKPKSHVFAVAGNNDSTGLWCSSLKRVVTQLPHVIRLELPTGAIAVEHGHRFGFRQPDHDKLREAHSDARLIVYGHTHKQVIEQESEPWIANPGAAGRVRNQGAPRCLVLNAGASEWVIESFIVAQDSTVLSQM
ncbi:MAG: metallophosphoesterase family protein [Pseudomonadota bacterium]